MSVSEGSTVATAVDMDELMSQLKGLETEQLFKVLKTALADAEKRAKASAKSGAKTARGGAGAKKTGSMPKGKVPPQLRKPRAWVEFVLKHALENGWEEFVIHNKASNEDIVMPRSVMRDGAHVYDVTDESDKLFGTQPIHKHAMSLSKQYWAPKDKTGTRHELYEAFEAQYVEEPADEEGETTSVASSSVVKKTAAEKEAEREAKKAAKEAEKEAKKAVKEAEKAAKAAAKEAEKAEKAAAKEAKKAEKETKPAAKADVPAAAVKKTKTETTEKKVEEVKEAAPTEKKPAAKKPAAAKKAEEWSCPADGMVHPWPYKGKKYLRNSDNEVWLRGEDGSCGEWQGIYLPAEDRIDDSVPEPVFEDEE